MNDAPRIWGYRRNEAGEPEAKIFDGTDLPEGWFDSPASVPDPEAPADRVIGEPDEGKKRRTSEQVDADEALIERAKAAGVEIPAGATVAEVEAMIAAEA